MFAFIHTHVHKVNKARLKWSSLKNMCFLLYHASLLTYVALPTLGQGGQAFSWKKRMCPLAFCYFNIIKKKQRTQANSLLWLCFSWFSLWLIDSVALGEEIHHDRSMEWTELIISWPRAERDEEEVAEASWPSLRACSLWAKAISWGSTSWNFYSIPVAWRWGQKSLTNGPLRDILDTGHSIPIHVIKDAGLFLQSKGIQFVARGSQSPHHFSIVLKYRQKESSES